MSVKSYQYTSNHGAIQTGVIQYQWLYGRVQGTCLHSDSKMPSMFNAEADAIEAIKKARSSGHNRDEINGALNNLEVPFPDFNNPPQELLDKLEVLESCCVWLWGSFFEGGCAIVGINDNSVTTILISHGVYKDVNNNYVVKTGGGGYRQYVEAYQECVVVFRGEDGTLNILNGRDDTSTYPLREFVETAPFIGSYYDLGNKAKSLNALGTTRASVSIIEEPQYAHLILMQFDDDNSYGAMGDPNGWIDDVTVPFEGLTKISGNWMGTGELEPQPDPEGTDEQGGNPIYLPTTDNSGETEESQFDVDGINSGLISIFNPTQDEIRQFCNFLFSGITEDISAFFKRLMSNPLDYVISLSMVHYTPAVKNTAEIKFGGVGSGVVSNLVAREIQIIECGTWECVGQFDTWLDYSNMTSAKIHLPYCGVFDLDVDLIMNSIISLKYIIDNLTGSCVAQLTITHTPKFQDDRDIKGTRYEFTGNVFKPMPLSASDYRSAIQGILTAIGGVGAIASGNPISGITSIASGVMSIKPNIQHASKADSNFGYLSNQNAFIEVIRPNPSIPTNQPYRVGYPTNKWLKLGDCSGLTIVTSGTFNANNISCTDDEKTQIINLLESGVII